jgi:cytochrome c-type biogenesis protein CcmH
MLKSALPVWRVLALLCLMGGLTAQANNDVSPTTPEAAALEARVQHVASELRCLVCQNQTVADSDADLAVDLRNQVRTMLAQGESEQAVRDYMTARYGEFVLYRPPFKASTVVLWLGPAVLLVGGLLALVWVLRRRARMPAEQFEPDRPEPEQDRFLS